MTSHLHGDIVECGVFKGSGLLTWLKILDLHEPRSIKKVVGFDFFDPGFVDELKNENDRELMAQVFNRDAHLTLNDVSLDGVRTKIQTAGFNDNKFELIRGDVAATTATAAKNKPGFRVSVLYLDMDLAEPTYAALTNLWDRVVPGGVVVLDEYAYHGWSESNGVDQFIQEKNLTLHRTDVRAPTGYIIK